MKRFLKVGIIAVTALTILSTSVFAQTTTRRRTTTKQTANVTNAEISRGLNEALLSGIRFAVNQLGRENGFLDDARVRIPLPKSLQKLEKPLRFAGQGKLVDEFVESMNHAAEKAVPVAFDVFVDSLRQMTFDDARQILFSGQEDAATRYFRRTSETRLREEFRPIVEEFTEEVGVTQKYKAMIDRYGFAGRLIGKDATDLDGYVTEKALDGLFYMVAEEEKKIRRDPVRRTTDILRKVFGILK